jgi:hypothetical protein
MGDGITSLSDVLEHIFTLVVLKSQNQNRLIEQLSERQVLHQVQAFDGDLAPCSIFVYFSGWVRCESCLLSLLVEWILWAFFIHISDKFMRELSNEILGDNKDR